LRRQNKSKERDPRGMVLTVQPLLDFGCVVIRPNLIWNSHGVLVSSCEECFVHNCVHRSRQLQTPKPLPLISTAKEVLPQLHYKEIVPRKIDARAHLIPTSQVPPRKKAYHGIGCPRCHSTRIVKRGFYKWKGRQKQKLLCRNCGRGFIQNPEKGTAKEVIDFALTQFHLGKSLRAIAKLIKERYGIKRSHVAISAWTRLPKKKRKMFCWIHGYYEGTSGCPKCQKRRKYLSKIFH